MLCVRHTEALISSTCAFYIQTANHWTVFQVQPLHCGGHTRRRREDLRSGTAQRPAEAPAWCRGGALNVNACLLFRLGIKTENNQARWTSPHPLSFPCRSESCRPLKETRTSWRWSTPLCTSSSRCLGELISMVAVKFQSMGDVSPAHVAASLRRKCLALSKPDYDSHSLMKPVWLTSLDLLRVL